MSKPKPFEVPEIKGIVGFRPTEQDKRNLRVLMATKGEASFSKLLRDLVAEAAVPARRRMLESAKRIAAMED